MAASTVDGSLRAYVPGQGLRQLLAAGPGGLITPDSILPVAGQDIHHGGADYLVIAADSLLAAGQQLAALHSGEGLRATVVPVSAISCHTIEVAAGTARGVSQGASV